MINTENAVHHIQGDSDSISPKLKQKLEIIDLYCKHNINVNEEKPNLMGPTIILSNFIRL